jgi:hypothetical protein
MIERIDGMPDGAIGLFAWRAPGEIRSYGLDEVEGAKDLGRGLGPSVSSDP